MGFFDDYKTDNINGIPILGTIDLSKYSVKDYDVFVALGDNYKRASIIEKAISLGFEIATLIHSSAVISKFSNIDFGTVIMPLVAINSNVVIGRGTIVNTGAVIEHDSIIGNYSHVSPNATINGSCIIEDYTWIGSSSTVIQGIKISKNIIIGADTLILKNIVDSGTYISVKGSLKRIK